MPLYRSRRHRILAGVCGGLAEWLGWGPTKVRILYLILGALPAFAGVPIYVVLWILIPKRPL
ncbi:MAG TPA: PspC domain-containing protein [Thermoanaerobaculia bacterium]|nr:PspC domain-containing protein [Thermoanaerobaculia bacterium]